MRLPSPVARLLRRKPPGSAAGPPRDLYTSAEADYLRDNWDDMIAWLREDRPKAQDCLKWFRAFPDLNLQWPPPNDAAWLMAQIIGEAFPEEDQYHDAA